MGCVWTGSGGVSCFPPAFCLLLSLCFILLSSPCLPLVWLWLVVLLKHHISFPANWFNWLTFVSTAALFGLTAVPFWILFCSSVELTHWCMLCFVSHHWLWWFSPFSECHACYHRSCFQAGKDCPRCQRLAERRERMARKNMEEQEDEGGGT